MPRGGARTGAGRKPKPIADHMREGTYRPHRHGPLPANVVPMPQPGADWRPSEADVEGLGERARDWLHATLRTYKLDDLEGRQVLAAMRVLTRVEALENTIAAAGVTTDEGAPNRLLMALAREQRQFVALWGLLRLGAK